MSGALEPAQPDDTAEGPEPRPEPAPEPAQPDDKDWTWVLERPCPECGADVGSMSVATVADANRQCATDWAEVLRSHPSVGERPAHDVWSPLEYGCHVRDVFRLFSERLQLMLTEDNPMFANWYPNTTQVAERYDLQDPSVVAYELLEAGTAIADKFATLTPDQLTREGCRSDGAGFTIESFARYEIHDPLHHLWDVTSP